MLVSARVHSAPTHRHPYNTATPRDSLRAIERTTSTLHLTRSIPIDTSHKISSRLLVVILTSSSRLSKSLCPPASLALIPHTIPAPNPACHPKVVAGEIEAGVVEVTEVVEAGEAVVMEAIEVAEAVVMEAAEVEEIEVAFAETEEEVVVVAVVLPKKSASSSNSPPACFPPSVVSGSVISWSNL